MNIIVSKWIISINHNVKMISETGPYMGLPRGFWSVHLMKSDCLCLVICLVSYEPINILVLSPIGQEPISLKIFVHNFNLTEISISL